MQLKLDPASGSSLTPGNSLTQRIFVNNSQHGVKPLVMRLRISWGQDGQDRVEQAEVTNFPPGL